MRRVKAPKLSHRGPPVVDKGRARLIVAAVMMSPLGLAALVMLLWPHARREVAGTVSAASAHVSEAEPSSPPRRAVSARPGAVPLAQAVPPVVADVGPAATAEPPEDPLEDNSYDSPEEEARDLELTYGEEPEWARNHDDVVETDADRARQAEAVALRASLLARGIIPEETPPAHAD